MAMAMVEQAVQLEVAIAMWLGSTMFVAMDTTWKASTQRELPLVVFCAIATLTGGLGDGSPSSARAPTAASRGRTARHAASPVMATWRRMRQNQARASCQRLDSTNITVGDWHKKCHH